MVIAAVRLHQPDLPSSGVSDGGVGRGGRRVRRGRWILGILRAASQVVAGAPERHRTGQHQKKGAAGEGEKGLAEHGLLLEMRVQRLPDGSVLSSLDAP